MTIRPISPQELVDPSFGANCIGCSPRNVKGLHLEFVPRGDEVHAEFTLSRDYESYPAEKPLCVVCAKSIMRTSTLFKRLELLLRPT